MKKKQVMITMAFSLPVLAFFAGMEFGRLNSPNYTTEDAGLLYLASHIRVKKNDGEDVQMEVSSPTKVFTYSLSKDTLEINPQDPFVLSSLPYEKRWNTLESKRMKDLAAIGATEGSVVVIVQTFEKSIRRISNFSARIIYAGAIVVGVAGGYFGYRLTYEDKADYDNANFKKILEDKKYWKYFASRLQSCQIEIAVFELSRAIEDNRGLNKMEKIGGEVEKCLKYIQWATSPAYLALD